LVTEICTRLSGVRNMGVELRRPHSFYFERREQEIVSEIERAGGDIFRVDLRRRMGGSNTTFAKKIVSLKRKGIIEEYKRGDGRLRATYRFTDHFRRLLGLERVLEMEKWFSASQTIQLFPEFERIAQTLMGEGSSVYEMLDIEPQHMFLETSLAASPPPPLEDREIRDVLSLCNAIFQNVITDRLHGKLQDQAEGFILFHYRLEKPREEVQRLLPECVTTYVKSSDPLEQHRASSKLAELAIQYPDLLHAITMAAMNIARALQLEAEHNDLTEKYRSYRAGEEPIQLTRMELVLSALNIFKKLYLSRAAKGRETGRVP